jgi:hypothetical protein
VAPAAIQAAGCRDVTPEEAAELATLKANHPPRSESTNPLAPAVDLFVPRCIRLKPSVICAPYSGSCGGGTVLRTRC